MTARQDIDDSAAPLVEHLAELRTRVLWSILAFVIAMVFCFSFGSAVLDFLLIPIEKTMRALGNDNPVMQYTAPQEYFFTLIRISMVGGLMLSFPVIAYQMWRFVAPGLYRSEKQAFLPFLIASPALFLLGAAFAHFLVVPMAMKFFLGFADLPSYLAALVSGETGDPADAGQGIEIVFNGNDITRLPMYKRARAGMAYLLQEPSVFRRLTVRQNLMAVLEHQPLSSSQRKERAAELMHDLNIAHLADAPAYTLSGGERRRTEICRALVTYPKVFLLDEPFAGIDPIAVAELQDIVHALKRAGIGSTSPTARTLSTRARSSCPAPPTKSPTTKPPAASTSANGSACSGAPRVTAYVAPKTLLK